MQLLVVLYFYFAFAGQHFERHGSIGHFEAFASHIVVVRQLVNVPKFSARHSSGRSPVVVQACAVGPCAKRDLVAQIVFGRVFKSFQQAVIECAPEVVALSPGHLASLCKGFEPELNMSLVASCLLTLAQFVYIAGQRAIVVGMIEIIQGGSIQRAVFEVYGRRHAHTVYNGSPVAVGVGRICFELVQYS